ncbi:hypothetical protein TREVI0001_1727 [Treponema vincentii ATCC 35580]|uniref:Uncharacterized protein n=1 Tax=Treponema vincentii ATCC 35580 TaxID=596324 RepID=C8PP07_9SPIR|nr:hypothetical protein TREVI0001_1727 [Treponema vincentii ATCC 35580]
MFDDCKSSAKALNTEKRNIPLKTKTHNFRILNSIPEY